jgi:hypothetical protein
VWKHGVWGGGGRRAPPPLPTLENAEPRP